MKIFILLVAIIPSISFASDYVVGADGTALMSKVYKQSQIIIQMQFDVEMVIENSENEKRKRYFTTWKKREDDYTQALMRFFRPNNLKNTALLSKSRDDDLETDQVIYLPALRRIVSIGSDKKHQSFMGSDFTNEDMGGRTISMDTHKILSVSGNKIMVEQIPVAKDSSYKRLVTEVNADRLTLESIVFYDKKGKLKKISNNKILLIDSKMHMPVISTVINYRTGGNTVLTVSSIKTDISLNNRFFSSKGLRQ